MGKMFRLPMAVFIAAAIGLISSAGGAAAAVKGPVAQIKDATFDFGSIPAGRDILHVFKIKNTGDAPLKITSVKTS